MKEIDMSKTILITGTSSGYGKAITGHFLAQGWNVIATMRRPESAAFAGDTSRLRVLPLAVTDEASIAALLEAAGSVDVLLNNAGIGAVGAFEVTPMALVRQLLETNTIGVTAMCQAVIPQMRARRSGIIVNVTSSVTLRSFPLAAAYTASKQAIEGFTGSLSHELAYFDIAVKLVEPGYAPTTNFGANAIIPFDQLLPGKYADFAKPIMEGFAAPALITRESDVAEGVWNAVHDATGRLRFAAGPDAVSLAEAG
jgi:NAD(P)-dependent dehydrogenase (short-subunit alcohol dehydrogenase family)